MECSEEVVKRIPNVRKLKIEFMFSFDPFNNLRHLRKLESLSLCSTYQRSCSFSLRQSLIKLKIEGLNLTLQDMNTVFSSLSLLQVLKLIRCRFGHEWHSVEFPGLKFLELVETHDLQVWTVDSAHFPCLEHLHLVSLDTVEMTGIPDLMDWKILEQMPSEISDIPNLLEIKLDRCSVLLVHSAQKILDEQTELRNFSLTVQVCKREYANFVDLHPNVEDGEEM